MNSLIINAIKILKKYHIENASALCFYLLEEKYNLKKESFFINSKAILSKKKIHSFLKDIHLLSQHMPIDYILESTHFMNSIYKVKKGVLIPRPETEILIRESIKFIKKTKIKHIVEIGCGSGIISCELAKVFPKTPIYSWDISKKAIETSKENAKNFNLKNIQFFNESAFSSSILTKYLKEDTLLISNPPYISRSETHLMDPSVLKYEPKRALFSGDNGLAFIKKLIQLASTYKHSLFFEMGIYQASKLKKIYPNILCYKDQQNINRIAYFKPR